MWTAACACTSSMGHRSLRTPLIRSCWQALNLFCVDGSASLVSRTGYPTVIGASSTSIRTKTAYSSLAFTSQPVLGHCCLPEQKRSFAIRRQRRREEPRKPEIPALPNAVDWDIDNDEVLLVHEDSTSVMSLSQAVTMAHSRSLNLVQVAVQKSQPVCRLLDFADMQRAHKQGHERKHAEDAEKEKRLAKMKGVRISWNIAQHDLEVKSKKVEEFLSKGKLVAVSTTYEHRSNKWQEQYPKAVEVAKSVWTRFKDQAHSWYDYSESGNKQVTVMYSQELPPSKGRHTLLPWEPGSMLPPFLQALQQDAQQPPGSSAGRSSQGGARGRSKRQ